MISENKKYFENDDEDFQYEVPKKARDKKSRRSKGRRRFDDGEYIKRKK